MNTRDAMALIEKAIPAPGGTWADIGAGEGTFTRALIELLGAEGRVYAVDRDADALAAIEEWPEEVRRQVIPVVADFTNPFELPHLRDGALDGMLIANALHYCADPAHVLARLLRRVKLGGRVVIVEYDRRGPSPWVPYPISLELLPAIAASAGLSAPTAIARRPSAFSGELYAAFAERLTAKAT